MTFFRQILRLSRATGTWSVRKTPSGKKHRPRRRSERESSLAITEVLEDRVLLSGNVTARTWGTSLIVRGDAEDNSVQISLENGSVQVTGTEGTTINGEDAPFVLSDQNQIEGRLVVSLGRGDDMLLLSDGLEIGGNLYVHMGRGADLIGADDINITRQYQS